MCDDPYIQMTVLVVDDHPTFRASVRRLLELDGFRVVAEAADARAALRLVQELEPELMLLDVGLPDRSGFEVAQELAGPKPITGAACGRAARSDSSRRNSSRVKRSSHSSAERHESRPNHPGGRRARPRRRRLSHPDG
jgi:DNA-binding NarL/FixJ family response regulator